MEVNVCIMSSIDVIINGAIYRFIFDMIFLYSLNVIQGILHNSYSHTTDIFKGKILFISLLSFNEALLYKVKPTQLRH